MRVWKRLSLAGMGVVVALAVFFWLAHELHAGKTRRFDGAVFHYFQARQSPLAHALMVGVSLLASGWAISGVSGACVLTFWLRPGWRAEAFRLLLSAAGGQGVVYALKALFHRARPEAIFEHLGYSFPSGHAFAAVTIYGMLAYWGARAAPMRRVGIWAGAVGFIGLIGFSRVFLGVHYASDVAAGLAGGLPWLWGCLALPYSRRLRE